MIDAHKKAENLEAEKHSQKFEICDDGGGFNTQKAIFFFGWQWKETREQKWKIIIYLHR